VSRLGELRQRSTTTTSADVDQLVERLGLHDLAELPCQGRVLHVGEVVVHGSRNDPVVVHEVDENGGALLANVLRLLAAANLGDQRHGLSLVELLHCVPSSLR
jgi:hypothetical protein